MLLSGRIDSLIAAQLTNNWTSDRRAQGVVDSLSQAEKDEIVKDVILTRVIEAEQRQKVTTSYPSRVPLHRELKVIPRDAAGQEERLSALKAERKVLADLGKAFTLKQKVTALVALEQYVIAVGDGSDVPWYDATPAQRQARLGLLTKQIGGLSDSRKLIENVDRILREVGTDTIREAQTKVFGTVTVP